MSDGGFMNLVRYYESITFEMMSMKDRVRNIIDDRHWLTDGEWKESVLRSVLKRHMPENVGVGRGFIISENGASSQIDVLLYDTSYPILFRDGDLVFVTPEAVKGIIEVKSKANNRNMKDAFKALSKNASLICDDLSENDSVFVGYFAYESSQRIIDERVFERLQSAYNQHGRIVNHVCIGNEGFYKFWMDNPENTLQELNSWHSYNLRESCIPYFINNLLNFCSNRRVDESPRVWFQYDVEHPERTKEAVRRNERRLIEDDNNE